MDFLAKIIIERNVELDKDVTARIKQELKKLKDVEFSSFAVFLSLAQRVGLTQTPSSLKQAFLNHFKTHEFTSEQVKSLPTTFLKEVGFGLFVICFPRGVKETV